MGRLLFLLFFLTLPLSSVSQSEVYELRVYELSFGKSANILHNYLEKAFFPALNRNQVKNIGAFEEVGEAMPKKIYLLIGYQSMQHFEKVAANLKNDEGLKEDSKSYAATLPGEIPFERISSSLIGSSRGFPNLRKPEIESNLYELRIYESYHEDALRRKVKMFDDHEFDIFEDTGLHMVFFGPNISGNQMPCLTYLLAFKDMKDRDDSWSKFGPHPEWQRIVKLEEYANTVSSITRVFLKPLAYSQL